jgi:Tfp pilus assembly protein PilV
MKPKTKNQEPRTNPKGFSFLEVMLSVFILVVGIMAAITLMGKSIKESLDSRNQIVASLLAQEGIELLRNIRDTNWLIPGNTSFTGFPISDPATCRIDITSGLNCVTLSKVLNYNSLNLSYSHTGGNATKFSRQIIIADSGNDKIVQSMVIWTGSDFPSISDCSTANGCAYAQLTMTKWGEN